MVIVAVPLVVVLFSVTGVVEPNEQVILVVAAGGAQARATAPLNPLVAVTVTVDVPACPGALTVAAVAATEKPGSITKPGHEVTSALASIEPSPVTRS